MLQIGIVGLPNVGKSTLFNALTHSKVLAANYQFATINPNVGIVNVNDARLAELAKIYASQQIVPATVKFVDVAGLVKGANKGEGLGNQFLANIRECNVVCHVVRAFNDNNVIRASDSVGPSEDVEIINTELMLSDIQTLDKRIPNLEKQAKSDPKLASTLANLTNARNTLGQGRLLNTVSDLNSSGLDELMLLTLKPMIYVFNVDEHELSDNHTKEILGNLVKSPSVFVCAELEYQLNNLSESEATELLKSYGQQESGLNQLVSVAYQALGLQSFLTAGPKEVRAWTIKKGSTAKQAAGVIHSDFERGFIAAEIVNFKDLIEAGSVANARSKGLVRTEGKDYIMQPEDVVEFRFNV